MNDNSFPEWQPEHHNAMQQVKAAARRALAELRNVMPQRHFIDPKTQQEVLKIKCALDLLINR
jgi:hypothetical protein